MSELDAIALGLAERLATIPDFEYRAYDVWPDNPNLPCVIVDGPTDIQELAFGCDQKLYEFDLVVLIPMKAGIAEAQRKVRPYLAGTGEASMQKALEADKTLGGRASTLIMRDGVRSLGSETVNDVPVFGVVRTVAVYS